MTTVDPYLLPVPGLITKADGTPSEEFKQWLIYNNRFNHDLWQSFTGGTGEETQGFKVVVVSNNYTTTGSEFLRVTTGVNITLQSSPVNLERVIIQPIVSDTVTVIGDIQGQNSIKMTNAYDSLELEFFSYLGEWAIT